ncbi:MAG TPA: PepSY domain-containing protein [Gemmataceae bacterium]|nr:PepSY domain-containing protein [Gemmataceae bacterium]
MSLAPTTSSVPARPISCDEALAIARKDAETSYRDLSSFRIIIERRADGWHIDYELSDVYLKGGGPHYIIDAETGAILAKRYEQ